MSKLVYMLFVSVYLLDYFALKLHVISKYVAWFPEIITMIVAVIVLALSSQVRVAISKGFSFLLMFFLLNMFVGVVLNTVPEGTLISGMRFYLKFLPFMLLPMVYDFDDSKINKILMLLLSLSILQTPIALYQRISQFSGVITGDVVTGTASSSGVLSVILYCVVAVVVSFYVKNKIKLSTMIVITLTLVIPTTINGTKSSLILLPIAIMLPLLMMAKKGVLRKAIPVFIVLAILSIILINVADSVYDKKNLDSGVMDFFSREGRLEDYLYKGVEVGDRFQHVGRVDSYVLALSVLSNDPWKLVFGLGIGNVAGSSISSLSGEYADEYARYGPGVTTVSQMIWEIGVFGVVLYFFMLFSIFKNSRQLSYREGVPGALGHGWSVVTIIMFIGLFYKNVLQDNIIIYVYWFVSGYVIAANMRFLRKPVDQSNSEKTIESTSLLSKRVTLKK